MIFISYRAKYNNNNKLTRFKYRNYDKVDLNWSNFFREKSIDEKVEIFNKYFFELLNEFAPLVEVKLKTQCKPWFTRELNDKLKRRKELYERYLACDRDNREEKKVLYREYRQFCSSVKNEINFLKRENLENAIGKAKTNKQRWNVLRTLGGNREQTTIGAIHNFDVNELNDFYASVHRSNLEDLPILDANTAIFNFNLIEEEDVNVAIRRISSNAIGHDEIPMKFLRKVSKHLLVVIVHIFNYSLSSCTFPIQWNKIMVRPIGKIHRSQRK